MKKLIIFINLLLVIFLASCRMQTQLPDNYNDSEFGYLDIKKDNLKIMQLTDLHFTYGFDYLDQKTFRLLNDLIIQQNPNIIVITGDLFMSIFALPILRRFIKFIEDYQIPWTITFGNHEREYHSMEQIVKVLMEAKTNYLYFHYGPKLSDNYSHGYANFKLKITNGSKPIVNLYLLDTKANRTDKIKDKRFPYDYLSLEQVEWYKTELTNDTVGSLAFMHIPLKQFLNYDGDDINETIWAQGRDTGFFDAIITSGKKTKGVFVGHDHLNRFSFYYEDILLAYGFSSGYNAYGSVNKGARIIELTYLAPFDYEIETYLVSDVEV